MNKPRRLCMVLAGIFAAVAAVSYAAPRSARPADSPAARKLLAATFATYRHVHSYREDGVTVYEQRMPGLQMRMDSHYTFAYRAPNLLYYERGPGMASSKMVCDGKSFYFIASMFAGTMGQVAKAPAPTDVAKLLNPKLFAQAPVMAGAPAFGASGLLSGEMSMSNVDSVQLGLPHGNRWLASLTRPPGSRVITIYVKGNPLPLVIWIDSTTHAVRQVASDFSQSGLREYMRQAQGGAGETPPGVLDMFKGMTMRTVVTVTPPKGAKIVEVKSVDEIAGGQPGAPSAPGDEAGPEAPSDQITLAGNPPIDFTAVDLDGKPVAISSFKGKPVVLDFCATWCPPCRAELPVLDEAFGKFSGQGLQVVAVFVDEDVAAVKKFLADNKYHFTVLWLDPASDEGKRVDKEYGITGIPRTLYVAGDWTVRSDNTGFSGKDETVKALAGLGFKSDF